MGSIGLGFGRRFLHCADALAFHWPVRVCGFASNPDFERNVCNPNCRAGSDRNDLRNGRGGSMTTRLAFGFNEQIAAWVAQNMNDPAYERGFGPCVSIG